jgi:hypothetical protein
LIPDDGYLRFLDLLPLKTQQKFAAMILSADYIITAKAPRGESLVECLAALTMSPQVSLPINYQNYLQQVG